MAKRIDLKETAKIIRTELKAAFPGIKFSIRTDFYSMGCHINVRYADGPPAKAVEAITNQFYGTGFDGMTDSTTYHNSQYKGEVVSFSGSRPSVSRDITDQQTLMTEIRALLKAADITEGYRNVYSPDWAVLGGMDLRWETPARAVAKFAHAGGLGL